MSDIINLLPENIANQIAAGEVIQRPASAVKELLENAVDAGATEIRLFVKDAGKALVQVQDNGKGMSETDARMCFERHATSKIKNIDDLFHIRTMGFRGEALASIAGVAQVEIRTRKEEDAVGTLLEIDNSIVRNQEPVATPVGTNISMKNLFFNVPARRNFLKSNNSELRHIIDEFIRVALAFPEILFTLTSNGVESYHLTKGSLKARIVQILGKNYEPNLVRVKEETDYINIWGFVGKPEAARKTRGDQYIFVNQRFIRSAYLNHAIVNAFVDLIPKESFPMYVLFIEIDPEKLDINVHPTKQEIKFEDEKIIYAFVKASVKHALAQFSVAPTLDFELDASIQRTEAVSQPFTTDQQISAGNSPLFKMFTQKNQAHFIESGSNLSRPGLFRDHSGNVPNTGNTTQDRFSATPLPSLERDAKKPISDKWLQIQNRYIIAENSQGILIIYQQHAHERILYERYAKALKDRPLATQKKLFPSNIEVSQSDAVILNDLLDDLAAIGYQINPFGNNSFVVQGTPSGIEEGDEQTAIDRILEQYKHFNKDLAVSGREKLLRTLAWQHAIKPGKPLSDQEVHTLIDDLFKCDLPQLTPGGKPVFMELKQDDLLSMFGK